MRRGSAALTTCLLVLLAAAVPAAAFDLGAEARNEAKSSEREAIYQQPDYVVRLQQESQRAQTEGALLAAQDPERNFTGNVCYSKGLGCAGDIRLNDWKANGYGLVEPTVWTARNGSTVSGHVWATRAGSRKRPAIVITNGSIQASEELYWWAAQTLAKAGYVVVTFDPQQQGLSDAYGEGADRNEGYPSQTEGNTFFDWTQDAIDFLLSTPAKPFCARPSRSGTSHCAKQERRVKAGLDAAYNPMWKLVERNRIGIAGHSYGASGVSWVGQQDKRVDAVVAWDNLCDTAVKPQGVSGGPPGGGPCLSGGQGPPPGYRVPSLGITADSFTNEPKTSDPDPGARGIASRAFSRAGVDSGSIAIRGGTHFEFSFLPQQPFRATLRGIDLATWYTRAWFDRYVKQDPEANRQLLTNRWRSDSEDRRVDPQGGGNLFSFYSRSRLDIGTGSDRFRCEDLRAGCGGQTASDGEPAAFSYVSIARTADRPVRRAAPALVAIQAARIARGRLRLRASTNALAAGRRVRVRLRAGGRTTSFKAKVGRKGRIAVRRRLHGRAARARLGVVSVRLAGSATVQTGSARVRVGGRAPRLRRTIGFADGRLTVRGTVARKVSGRIAVTLSYLDGQGKARRLVRRARIAKRRFRLALATPYPVRFDGAGVTVAYAGSAKRRVRGQQIARFVSP